MSESVSWIDPYGVEHPLNVEGTLGRFMPPVALVEQPIPVGSGSRINHARNTARPLTVDIYLLGDETTLRTQERELARAFDTTNRGPGILRNTAPDGTVREVTGCYYEAGLEGDDAPGARSSDRHKRYSLVLRSVEPFWKALDTVSVSWPVGTETTTFFPLFPLQLGSSSVIGSVTLGPDNGLDTEVPIWPTWVVDGPGTNVQLTNLNTNEAIVWNGTLAAGDQLVIDTSEDRKTVLLNGANAFSSLTSYGFWRLRPGTNDLTVAMDNTDTNSRIAAYWRNAYLTP